MVVVLRTLNIYHPIISLSARSLLRNILIALRLGPFSKRNMFSLVAFKVLSSLTLNSFIMYFFWRRLFWIEVLGVIYLLHELE